MNLWRNGQLVTACDQCWRWAKTGEGGWVRREGAIDPAAIMVSDGPGRDVARGEVPAQPIDYCPRCASEARGVVPMKRRTA